MQRPTSMHVARDYELSLLWFCTSVEQPLPDAVTVCHAMDFQRRGVGRAERHDVSHNRQGLGTRLSESQIHLSLCADGPDPPVFRLAKARESTGLRDAGEINGRANTIQASEIACCAARELRREIVDAGEDGPGE